MFKIMVANSLIENGLYVKCLFKSSIYLLKNFIQKFKHQKNLSRYKGLILIAEDDYLHQKLDRLIIEQSVYNVILTSNGLDTLEKFKEFKNLFDLILLDAGLPGMMGTEVCRSIRAMGFPAIPIIFLSANVEHFTSEAKVVGASECLTKPLTASRWHDICKRWLKKK